MENKDELRFALVGRERNFFNLVTDKSDLSRGPSTMLPLSSRRPAGLGTVLIRAASECCVVPCYAAFFCSPFWLTDGLPPPLS